MEQERNSTVTFNAPVRGHLADGTPYIFTVGNTYNVARNDLGNQEVLMLGGKLAALPVETDLGTAVIPWPSPEQVEVNL